MGNFSLSPGPDGKGGTLATLSAIVALLSAVGGGCYSAGFAAGARVSDAELRELMAAQAAQDDRKNSTMVAAVQAVGVDAAATRARAEALTADMAARLSEIKSTCSR